MKKFNKLFNKIIIEQKNKLIKEYVDYPHLKSALYIPFNAVIYPFVANLRCVKNWKREKIENFIADLWADTLLPDLSKKIRTILFDKLINQDQFMKLTQPEQEIHMKQAITDANLIENLNSLAIDYNDNYMINQGINPENPDDNMEEIPEDF